jgi:hypothetical protein
MRTGGLLSGYMGSVETRCVGRDWIHLAWDWNHRWVIVNTVMNFTVWTMHFQIMKKEKSTKCIFKVNHIFRI